MLIDRVRLDEHLLNGSWRSLEALALKIVADAQKRAGVPFSPRLGGGTRLMLSLRHRISDDIDLFIRDPQWIGYITPRLNDAFEHEIDDYEEASAFVKFKRREGEIDFIVAMSLLDLEDEHSPLTPFVLEPMAEVLAKKLFYRGWALTARDLYDWWAIETLAPGEVPFAEMGALLRLRRSQIEAALKALTKSSPARQQWDHLAVAQRPDLADVAAWADRQLSMYVESAAGNAP